MATRRPASSRARVNTTNPPSNAPPQLHQRSRSVLAKAPPDIPALKPQKSEPTQDDGETNIQVVLRWRGRSEREIQDNSPVIVSSQGAKSKELTIEASPAVYNLGVATPAAMRTYPFDYVFGPEADQAMVYHEVVSPMLEEVLMGYNCTLFAYGQTGTGKTHTMQGDLNPSPMGNPSVNAGMIPRVLFRLFHYLDSLKVNGDVKISYIELYNEELRDLLAHDFAAPVGSTQPMGMGPKTADNGLKLYDDANKRGVVITGLEEVKVSTCKAALAVLAKGSQRRQIAATNFNDRSSRSHSVFSITVHITENSPTGEELVKIGKLNLVDLAGSENIGRSGAENQRAREAGMINQSLLTLGRVITALADKASHVPYRESKLTRILQDSLGGRTKTCIIATISPSRCNLEETLSTLDYALRAKNIRNRPEVNQRMTRSALLREYSEEIERLKADLLAAREKNGLFISEESWMQMETEKELFKMECEEAKKQVEIVDKQLRSVRNEYEESIGLLMLREGELKDTREKLQETEEVLEEKQKEVVTLQEALEDEIVVRQAHQTTETVLNGVALGLRSVAHQSVKDVSGLFDKLERKSSVLSSNTRTVIEQGKIISGATNSLSRRLNEFAKASSTAAQKLQAEAKDFHTKELEALTAHSARLEAQLQTVQQAVATITAKNEAEAEALTLIQTSVKTTQETTKSELATLNEVLESSCQQIYQNVEQRGSQAFATVEEALQAMASLVEGVVRDAREHMEQERQSISVIKNMGETTANEEITRLKAQNKALVRLLEQEKVKADQAKDELIQRVSAMLGEFTNQRDKDLRAAVGIVQKDNQAAETRITAFATKHSNAIQSVEDANVALGGSLQRRQGDNKRTRDQAFQAIENAQVGLKSGLGEMRKGVTTSAGLFTNAVNAQAQSLVSACNSGFEQHSRAKRMRIQATASLATDAESEYRHALRSLASTSRNITSYTGEVASGSSSLVQATSNYREESMSRLISLNDATEVLASQGAQADPSTGETPRKRAWKFTDQWELTQNREVLLRKRRGPPSTENHPLGTATTSLDTEDLNDRTQMPLEPQSPSPVDDDSAKGSPNVPSLTSSISSVASSVTSIPAPAPRYTAAPPPSKKGVTKSNSTMGTLVDARNVYTTRGTRRAR